MKFSGPVGLAVAATVWMSPGIGSAQPVATPDVSARATPSLPEKMISIPEGTEIQIAINERLSSATSANGDRFSITTVDPIKLTDGSIIPAGYRGAGEVTNAQKRGMMGKGGELNIRIDYIRVGETKIPLRANQGREGQDSMGATVALTFLFGPLGLLKHGHDVDIPAGQKMTAYVDANAQLATPLAAPPAHD